MKHFSFLFLFPSVLAYCQDINEGLLLQYEFNGNFEDSSVNVYHGENYGAMLTEDRFGNPESALWFDGVDDYFEFPDLDELKPELPVSFSFWVKYDIVEGESNYIFSTSFEEGVSSGVYFCTEKLQESML